MDYLENNHHNYIFQTPLPLLTTETSWLGGRTLKVIVVVIVVVVIFIVINLINLSSMFNQHRNQSYRHHHQHYPPHCHHCDCQIRSKDEQGRSPVRGGGRGSLTAPNSRKTSAVRRFSL